VWGWILIWVWNLDLDLVLELGCGSEFGLGTWLWDLALGFGFGVWVWVWIWLRYSRCRHWPCRPRRASLPSYRPLQTVPRGPCLRSRWCPARSPAQSAVLWSNSRRTSAGASGQRLSAKLSQMPSPKCRTRQIPI